MRKWLHRRWHSGQRRQMAQGGRNKHRDQRLTTEQYTHDANGRLYNETIVRASGLTKQLLSYPMADGNAKYDAVGKYSSSVAKSSYPILRRHRGCPGAVAGEYWL